MNTATQQTERKNTLANLLMPLMAMLTEAQTAEECAGDCPACAAGEEKFAEVVLTTLSVTILPDSLNAQDNILVLASDDALKNSRQLDAEDDSDVFSRIVIALDLPTLVENEVGKLANLIDKGISVVVRPYFDSSKEGVSAAIAKGIEFGFGVTLVGIRIGHDDDCFWISSDALEEVGQRLDMAVEFDSALCIDKSAVTE